ncbi:hypothetical protein B0E55_06282 [Rhodococcus sp. 66b]|nr:hypothetical protein B0E55_06282 [Rhodococcus sp. 66b]
MHAHRDDLFGIARKENRHAHCCEGALTHCRYGRRFGCRIVAHQQDDAAPGVDAIHVRVANGIGSAVDTGPLAVPVASDSIELRGSCRKVCLATPHRGGRKFLVEAGYEGDVVLGENLGHPVKHLVHPAQWTSLVPGDKSGNTLTCPSIANMLLDETACDCLNTGQQHRARSRPIPIIEIVRLRV